MVTATVFEFKRAATVFVPDDSVEDSEKFSRYSDKWGNRARVDLLQILGLGIDYAAYRYWPNTGGTTDYKAGEETGFKGGEMKPLQKAGISGLILFVLGVGFCELASAASQVAQATECKCESAPSTFTKVHASPLYTNGAAVVEAELWIGTAEPGSFSYPDLDSFTGNSRGRSRPYLRNLNLALHGKAVTIPHSAIAGLFYPKSITLNGTEYGDRCTIHLAGTAGLAQSRDLLPVQRRR